MSEQSVAQAVALATRARAAMLAWRGATQAQVDRVCEAMARAGEAEAERLGRLAWEETGYGRPSHKTLKNVYCSRVLWESIRDIATCGVIARDPVRKVIEIAEPAGVIAGLVPVTNPTSTVLFKSIITAKSRNAIVFAPHPRARRCIAETTRVMDEAAVSAGAPRDLVLSMTEVSLQGTEALMRTPETKLILATGSRAMVLAAYSSGKPTIAVGPGNHPAYVHSSVADVDRAAACVMASKVFDWGTACVSEQSAIADRAIAPSLRAAMERRGARFLTPAEQDALLRAVFPKGPQGPYDVDCVSQSPATLAALAGFDVPETTSLLVVQPGGIGPAHPFSREILGPIFKWLEVDGAEQGIATAVAQVRFGGEGHTSSIHASDEAVIARYAAEIPTYRVLVNTPAIFGAPGFVTGLDVTFMIGTGFAGGSITGDNVGPRHLMNIKRVATATGTWDEPGVTPEEGRVAQWARDRIAGGGTAALAVAAAPGLAQEPRPDADASIEELVRRAVEEVMSGG